MPCYVDYPIVETKTVTKKESDKFNKLKKRGERAEEALCHLSRAVIEKDSTILIELLSTDKKFRKTWKKHQKYDCKEGRSYWLFDEAKKELVYFANSEEIAEEAKAKE